MIELIFVIVILGILASIAIPKLAATRDDAKLASIKTDIGSTLHAVPAWYQGQKDVRLMEAIHLDATTWKQQTTGTQLYTWSDHGNVCVTLAVVDMNITDFVSTQSSFAVEGVDYNSTNGFWLSNTNVAGVPVLRLVKGTLTSDGAVTAPVNPTANCNTLWSPDGFGLVEQNISMAGKKIVW